MLYKYDIIVLFRYRDLRILEVFIDVVVFSFRLEGPSRNLFVTTKIS